LRADGLEVEGSIGEADPLFAILSLWDPAEFDEILLSTLPVGASRWLRADLPRRVERLTGALVSHVVSGPGRQASRLGETAASGFPEGQPHPAEASPGGVGVRA
jgi:hypothetical protein